MNVVPRWRVFAGIAVLVSMLALLGIFTPIYLHNLQLQSYVASLTQDVGGPPKSDAELQALVLQKAHSLGLPVSEDNVHIIRSAGSVRIDVRYLVPVQFPGYSVNLHFYPGAGSRP